MDTARLWLFLPLGYLLTVAVETPVLVLLLSPRHTLRRRLFAGLWLTACTYPVVVLVLPVLFGGASRAAYLAVAEVFAPVAECALFWLAFGEKGSLKERSTWRDFAAVTLANVLSFLAGEVFTAYNWFGLFG
ncbi:MAG TPA: hypothetical protein VNZ44_13810 [Pyrinomonadaceae bacterium]|nr:hypothetical protein [Pyrinomonadaceae bacterium]